MAVCCRIQLCCPPDRAARALAEYLADGEPENAPGGGSYTDIAARVLAEFQLVPLSIEPEPGAPHPQAGREMLERLHRHIRAELRQILIALGHETEAAP